MNSRMATVIGTLLLLACAATGWAGLVPEEYRSTDLGGRVLLGRLSHSELDGLAAKPGIGEVFNAASWDGQQLGTQWAFSCGAQVETPAVKRELDSRGDGYVWTDHRFVGGRFFLAADGPWDRRGMVAGKLYETRMAVTETYVTHKRVRVDLALEGYGMDENGGWVRWLVNKCLAWGETGEGRMPLAYPLLLDTACQPTRDDGYWYEMGEITIKIESRSPARLLDGEGGDVPAPARPSTWGAVKAIYR